MLLSVLWSMLLSVRKCIGAIITLPILVACGSAPPQSLQHEFLPTVAAQADRSRLYISFPAGKDVVFLGKISTEQAEQVGAGMVYPGYSAASFLAGILVHAAAQGGFDAAEERKRREQANKILEKYEAALKDVNRHSLTEQERSIDLGEESVLVLRYDENRDADANLYLAQVEPVFYIAQNERSLVLSNRITLKESHQPDADARLLLIEYVSSPYLKDNPTEYWSDNAFRNFTETAKFIFKESLHLALQADRGLHSSYENSHETIRYYESGKKKVERGYVIEDRCDRIVFMTLRESIKSVPVYSSEGSCI